MKEEKIKMEFTEEQMKILEVTGRRLLQASAAHPDRTLHPDLMDAGMDIGVNGIDDIQDPDQPDEQDQSPAEQTDLLKALSHLRIGFPVGEPSAAWIFCAPCIQPAFKFFLIRTL